MEMKSHLRTFGLLLGLSLAMVSCNSTQKFAKEFVRNSNTFSVLVLSPDFVYMDNLNTQLVDSLGITDQSTRDSILWEQSSFLKKIDDSLFMANYILGYKTEIRNYGIKVFDENSSADFFNLDSNAMVVNIAQVGIEEEDYEYRDETEYYGYVYFHDHIFKAVNINTWFELSLVNDTTENDNLFFTTNTITDDLNSSFDFNPFSEKVEYSYEVDSLNLSKIYEYVYLLGRIYATYTFDFMMNSYINGHSDVKLKKEELLRYNPNTRGFFIAGENRFIGMDE